MAKSYHSFRFGGGMRFVFTPFATLQAEAGEDGGGQFNSYNVSGANNIKSAPYVETRLNVSF